MNLEWKNKNTNADNELELQSFKLDTKLNKRTIKGINEDTFKSLVDHIANNIDLLEIEEYKEKYEEDYFVELLRKFHDALPSTLSGVGAESTMENKMIAAIIYSTIALTSSLSVSMKDISQDNPSEYHMMKVSGGIMEILPLIETQLRKGGEYGDRLTVEFMHINKESIIYRSGEIYSYIDLLESLMISQRES